MHESMETVGLAIPGKDKAQASDAWRTVLTAAVTGFLTVVGTVGAAYLAGYFDVAKTDRVNSGSIDLEKLKFANDLIKTALSSDNSANSLLFYADIGLLSGLNVDVVKRYAENENARIKHGVQTESILPSFRSFGGQGLWLDRNFMAAFAPKASEPIAQSIISTGNYILRGFEISKNKNRLANFLGQIAYETQGLTVVSENGDFSAERLLQVYPNYFDTESAKAYAHQPEKILSRVYANRTGNGPEESGDGFRFRGRGFIQITGRTNYQRLSQETGIDLVTDPTIAGNPDAALLIAVAYWTNAGLNETADLDQTAEITKKISGSDLSTKERRVFVQSAINLLEGSK